MSRSRSKQPPDAEATIRAAARTLLDGDPREARDLLRSIPEDDPCYAISLHLAGLAAARADESFEAIALLQQALTLEPARHAWRLDLATLQYSLQLWNESAASFEAAARGTELGVRSLRYWAQALRALGEHGHCAAVLERYLNLQPDAIDVRREAAEQYGLCGLFHDELRHREILAGQLEAEAEPLLGLSRAQFQTGRTAEAIATAQKYLERKADAAFHSEYLVMLLHDERQSGASLRAAHEDWARRYISGTGERPAWSNTPDPARRLRIGYVCGEAVEAPSHYFLTSLLDKRDRRRFHVTWYHASLERAARTAKYAEKADQWRDISGKSEDDVTAQIRADAIDILVDVSGHYESRHLGVLARRPAPIQVSFPNYRCTTGVPGVDYILTDDCVCPEGAESQYTEEVVRIPSGYLAYATPDAPEPRRRENGPVTFGIFERPARFTDRFWDAVASILRRSPGSRLLIHYCAQGLEQPESPAQRALRSELERRGIERDRVQFAGRVGASEHLSVIGGADIALDTFPYNGQTTTCECLLMGVPVISISGDHHVARVGLSLLTRVGAGDLCASDPDEYVELAVALAGDRARLRQLQRELRPRLLASPLVNGRSVVETEDALVEIWRRRVSMWGRTASFGM